jgi:hypothetical protein
MLLLRVDVIWTSRTFISFTRRPPEALSSSLESATSVSGDTKTLRHGNLINFRYECQTQVWHSHRHGELPPTLQPGMSDNGISSPNGRVYTSKAQTDATIVHDSRHPGSGEHQGSTPNQEVRRGSNFIRCLY